MAETEHCRGQLLIEGELFTAASEFNLHQFIRGEKHSSKAYTVYTIYSILYAKPKKGKNCQFLKSLVGCELNGKGFYMKRRRKMINISCFLLFSALLIHVDRKKVLYHSGSCIRMQEYPYFMLNPNN